MAPDTPSQVFFGEIFGTNKCLPSIDPKLDIFFIIKLLTFLNLILNEK